MQGDARLVLKQFAVATAVVVALWFAVPWLILQALNLLWDV